MEESLRKISPLARLRITRVGAVIQVSGAILTLISVLTGWRWSLYGAIATCSTGAAFGWLLYLYQIRLELELIRMLEDIKV